MEDITTEAFVLRTRAYAESDRIVVLLTRDHGKLSAIAKGARRSKRRFPGGVLELFQHVEIRFARRPHSSLAFLHECQLVASHHGVAGDVLAFAWASYLCELTDLMTPERDVCRDLYELFGSTLASMSRGEPAEPLAHHFVLGLLERGGWGPDFSACGVCGEVIDESSRPILDERGSGVMCARHEAERRGHDAGDPSFQPSRRVIEPGLLDYVSRASVGPVLDAQPDVQADASLLLDRLVSLHVSRPLKSREFLRTAGR